MDWLSLPDPIIEIISYFAAALTFTVMLIAAGHALLHKRDSRSAAAWVALIVLSPLVGSVFYALFGINRIRRKAASLRGSQQTRMEDLSVFHCEAEMIANRLPPDKAHLANQVCIESTLISVPLLRGNRMALLENGEAAYPAMLAAIEQAGASIGLSTYIFNNDPVGHRFLEALRAARARGVAVRVLIDDVGARYSWPSSMIPLLRKAGLRTARFLPTVFPLRMAYLNLRNHRKLLVVDGRLAFTGGMNIQQEHLADENGIRDLHFSIEGPAVVPLRETFADDWQFATGEALDGEAWFSRAAPAGYTPVRVIRDGPDIHFEKIWWTMQGALKTARHSVRIITPYFLPDRALIAALNLAAMSGVQVDIILPAHNNLLMVKWASIALIEQLTERCRIWFSHDVFDHTKVMIVDGTWVMLGSANWDSRSLRLNFELNLSCYDTRLAEKLDKVFLARRDASARWTRDDDRTVSLPARIRNGFARLFTPFL